MAMAADEGSQLNGADMAYMAISTLLVLIMTPALAFFYGGLVRRKNTINTIMMSMVCLAIFTVQWFVYGYSLSFGPDVGGIIGNLDWAFFHDVGMAANPDYSETIPHILFALFQMAFAILTPAIFVLSTVGAYAMRSNVFDVYTTLAFGLLGSIGMTALGFSMRRAVDRQT